MTKRPKPGRGRPLKHPESGTMTPRMIRLPSAMLDEIDAIRAERLDQPDVSSVIRELIAEALQGRRAKRR